MRTTLTILLSFAGVWLTGCIAPHVTMPVAQDNHYHSDLPPVPTADTAPAYRMPSLRGELAPAAPVAPWPTLTLAWEHGGDCDGYRVYHGTNLNRNTWAVLGTTTNRTFKFQSNQFGFVGVKAYRGGSESGWGTPQ